MAQLQGIIDEFRGGIQEELDDLPR